MSLIPPAQLNWRAYSAKILPGLLLCLALGAIARSIEALLITLGFPAVNYVVIAIVLGLIARNVLRIPKWFDDGLDFARRICLYIGIVLLGAGLNLFKVFSIGGTALIMVATSITICVFACGWLVSRVNGNERAGHLLGMGLGVCGISAIMATAPTIKAREREIATAIGCVLINDVVMVMILPTLALRMGWSDMLAGFLSGVIPSNTAQCIAIGHAYSDSAGTIATIVKSARNVLMPWAILSLTYVYVKRGLPVGDVGGSRLLWAKFPKFILGMLVASILSTMGVFGPSTIALSKSFSSWFFLVCFVGLGAGIDIRDLGRRDLSMLGLGLLVSLVMAAYAFLFSTLVLGL